MSRYSTALGALLLSTMAAVVPLRASDPTATAREPLAGDYFESRTADIYTGPCFANGEVNLTGKEALMVWHIRSGSWKKVPLGGLNVVAVLRANVTLGDPFAGPAQVRSVLLIDQRASREQAAALVEFARQRGGALFTQVVRIERAPIDVELDRETGGASVRVRDLVELRTRPLNHHDHFCGNETVYYPPLAKVALAVPAYTIAQRYSGTGLGSTWSWPDKRSAFIGTFTDEQE